MPHASSHRSRTPFTHACCQLDVVFPTDPELEQALRALDTHYYTSSGHLSEIFNAAHALAEDTYVRTVLQCAMTFTESRGLQILSTGKFVPDVWSMSDGKLALNVAKETYELLGLQGKKLASLFPHAPEQFREDVHLLRVMCRALCNCTMYCSPRHPCPCKASISPNPRGIGTP
ncbi:hypothetical protein FA95DRAFT_7941 [Auriscalpium vulgare]|uniref:Uncharacterized protein n=1 Tax=Auriscalpium vulgare TaxID=40419 RepID=A0ACB8SD33_9AGAM|nr:hypothetical protein FA95DRAFT_7941 [Auriscalpium vulgare]